MTWPCFWVESTGEVQLSLRRYSAEGACPTRGTYHDASAPVGRRPERRGPTGSLRALDEQEFERHPAWPESCACGYRFTDDDNRQANQDAIYADGHGREWPSRSLPPGAMFDSPWNKRFGAGPDGIALTVVLPPDAPDGRGHWWHVDGPSRNNGVPGPGWTRTGDPRNPSTLTVVPSILTADYHGFLTAGVLSDSL